MLLLAMTTKLLAEIALLALVGRWVLLAWIGRLAPGSNARSNAVLWLFDTLCRPVVRAAGWIAPGWVPQALHPLVAGCVLAVVWLAATFGKIALCVDMGVQACL